MVAVAVLVPVAPAVVWSESEPSQVTWRLPAEDTASLCRNAGLFESGRGCFVQHEDEAGVAHHLVFGHIAIGDGVVAVDPPAVVALRARRPRDGLVDGVTE